MTHAAQGLTASVIAYRLHRQSRPGASELMTRCTRYWQRRAAATDEALRRFRATMADGRF